MNYIYTCNGASATDAANDALMFPANRVTRIDGVSATTTQIYIEAHDGTADYTCHRHSWYSILIK